jgi:membrane dipeptidase
VEYPIFDGHNDLAWELRRRTRGDLAALDLRADHTASGLHTDLPRLKAGRVGAQFWSVYAPDGPDAVAMALEQIDVVRRLAVRYPDDLVLAVDAEGVEQAAAAGRVASLIGVEGGHLIGGSLGVLRMFHALGARYLTLTHVRNTEWADSATDTPRAGGLTDFGRDVVRELNRLGMLVDLAHVAPSTMHAALDVSSAPAFFSHSSARALCDTPRNVPDDVLARVRDTNGVVMVTFVPGFLNEECREWMVREQVEEERLLASYAMDDPAWADGLRAWVDANPPPPSDVSDVADHVEYVREVAGLDAVGLGSDFDGMGTTPDGLADVSAYPALMTELAGRGWSSPELGALGWGNALRVLRDTEAAARASA